MQDYFGVAKEEGVSDRELEAIQSQVTEMGGRIVKETFEFPGGRRFHFTDPSGNELAIWSDQ